MRIGILLQAGADHCELAHIGFYVDQTASTNQTACPDGNSTTTRGSTSIMDCYLDTDMDEIPDIIDEDDDNDGFNDTDDQFPLDPTEWVDTDGDGTGNNADSDDDDDGWTDIEETITCGDSDPLLDNSTPLDTDGDGLCNQIDSDDDNDFVDDASDDFPLDACASSDFDQDGLPVWTSGPCDTGLVADPDIDGDGYNNTDDWSPLDPTEWIDTDGDGMGDNQDWDDDGDGVPDDFDTFPLNPTEWGDNDGDGMGDNQDTDDDNDGYPDLSDDFPSTHRPRSTLTSMGCPTTCIQVGPATSP